MKTVLVRRGKAMVKFSFLEHKQRLKEKDVKQTKMTKESEETKREKEKQGINMMEEFNLHSF